MRGTDGSGVQLIKGRKKNSQSSSPTLPQSSHSLAGIKGEEGLGEELNEDQDGRTVLKCMDRLFWGFFLTKTWLKMPA